MSAGAIPESVVHDTLCDVGHCPPARNWGGCEALSMSKEPAHIITVNDNSQGQTSDHLVRKHNFCACCADSPDHLSLAFAIKYEDLMAFAKARDGSFLVNSDLIMIMMSNFPVIHQFTDRCHCDGKITPKESTLLNDMPRRAPPSY